MVRLVWDHDQICKNDFLKKCLIKECNFMLAFIDILVRDYCPGNIFFVCLSISLNWGTVFLIL